MKPKLKNKTGMRPRTQTALDNIRDTFSGADGCVGLAQFLAFLSAIEERAVSGDSAAEQVLDVMRRFSRMIDMAKGDIKP